MKNENSLSNCEFSGLESLLSLLNQNGGQYSNH